MRWKSTKACEVAADFIPLPSLNACLSNFCFMNIKINEILKTYLNMADLKLKLQLKPKLITSHLTFLLFMRSDRLFDHTTAEVDLFHYVWRDPQLFRDAFVEVRMIW